MPIAPLLYGLRIPTISHVSTVLADQLAMQRNHPSPASVTVHFIAVWLVAVGLLSWQRVEEQPRLVYP